MQKKQREYADQQEELSGEICTKNLDQRKLIESLKEEKESLIRTNKRKEGEENRLRNELGRLINRNHTMEDELTLRSCEEEKLRDKLNAMSEELSILRQNQKEKEYNEKQFLERIKQLINKSENLKKQNECLEKCIQLMKEVEKATLRKETAKPSHEKSSTTSMDQNLEAEMYKINQKLTTIQECHKTDGVMINQKIENMSMTLQCIDTALERAGY